MKANWKTGVIIAITLVMGCAQINPDMVVHAEEAFVTTLKDETETRKLLEVAVQNTQIASIKLMKDNVLIDEQDVNGKVVFTINENGTYQITGYNPLDKEVYQTIKTVDSFEELIIQEKNSQEVQILSRNQNTHEFSISGADTFVLSTQDDQYGKRGSFQVVKNGTYHVTAMDRENKVLAKKDIVITSVMKANKADVILLNKESDLLQIVDNPSGHYQLGNDIDLTSQLLKDVNFQGSLDGNGYKISGVTDQLFNTLTGATLSNLSVDGGRLAQQAINSTIDHSGFYLHISDEKAKVALIQKSENTIISHSYVLANIEALEAAGFILEGTAQIQNSYVSGYIKADKVFGFGQDIDVKDSYVSASLLGKERVMFTNGEVENNFYDVQVNDFGDEKARAYTNQEITSGKLQKANFLEKEGSYPQLLNLENFSEKAKQQAMLSVVVVNTDNNLSSMTGNTEVSEVEGIEWKSVGTTIDNKKVALSKKQGEVQAVVKETDMMNRFSLRSGTTISAPVAGSSTTLTSTQITYPVAYGKYYKVRENGTSVTMPTTHKAAIEDGWKIAYWDGVDRAIDLAWHTKYNVYTTDLLTMQTASITTNKQLITGSLTLTGTYESGETMTATMNGVEDGITGTLYFETSLTREGSTWTQVGTPIDNFTQAVGSATVHVVGPYYTYLRARFEPNTNSHNTGNLITMTEGVLKHDITTVTIVNKKPADTMNPSNFSLGDKLYVEATPGTNNDLEYTWYHADNTDAIGTGMNYTLKSTDIGKQIKVIAKAKENGLLKGEKASDPTSIVKTVKLKAPTKAPKLKGAAEDTIFTIYMDETDGLYQFEIKDVTNNKTVVYPTLSRANSQTIIISIVGLIDIKPSTSYEIRAKQIGEYGYEDSEYGSQVLSVTTGKKRVSGNITISGDNIFNEALEASVTTNDVDQVGEFKWYRLDGNTRIDTGVVGKDYTLTVADVDKRLEVEFYGKGLYSGEISNTTDIIQRKDSASLADDELISVNTSSIMDKSVEVTLPTNTDDRKYIIGYSKTKDGAPKEYEEDNVIKIYDASDTTTLKGLERDTDYYLFTRYAQNDTTKKSEWVSNVNEVKFKTAMTTFSGQLTFVYENAKNQPMPGQRLQVNLTSSVVGFEKKGTWTWVAKNGSTTETIENYVLTDDKLGTYIIVPNDVAANTTYEVTFSATSGFTGSVTKTSTVSIPYEKQTYDIPDENLIQVTPVSDTSIAVSISGVSGQYKFRYAKKDAGTTFGLMSTLLSGTYSEVSQVVYGDVEVIITGLERNKEYVVSAMRVEDNEGYQSGWSADSSAAKTEQTEIAGNVTLEGEARNGQVIKATYNKATYSPAGNDELGSWTWYRGETKMLTGFIGNQYTLSDADVNQTITAKYTIPDNKDFKGVAQASTTKITKAINSDPTLTIEKTGQSAVDDHLYLEIKNADTNNTYYQLKSANDPAPATPSDSTLSTWKKITSSAFQIDKDQNDSNLVSLEKYVLYVVRIESEYAFASNVVSNPVTVSKKVQKGEVVYSGRSHVGKEFAAKLTNYNNDKGTWHWYYSNTNYTNTNPSAWTEITEGFSPKSDNEQSTLTVPDVAKGRFLKAEFIADETRGFTGKISKQSPKWVTKTYTEKLTISGRGYRDETLTVTVSGSDRDMTSSAITKYVRFQNEDGSEFSYGSYTNVSTSSYTYRLTELNYLFDGKYLCARISTPDRKIYTNEDGSDIGEYIFSTKDERIKYNYGIRIDNAEDLYYFIYGATTTKNYTDRSGYYVITNNINAIYVNSVIQSFSGNLNGDFHTIQNLSTRLTNDNSNSTIRNLFIASGGFTNTSTETGLFSQAQSSNFKISQVYIVNYNLIGAYNVGMFLAKHKSGAVIERSGSAGGSVTTKNTHPSGGQDGATLSGVLGWGYAGNGTEGRMTDISNINTELYNNRYSSKVDGCGALWGGGIGEGMVINRAYVASTMGLPYTSATPNGRAGILTGVYRQQDYIYNTFYDSKLIKRTGNYWGDPFTLNQSSWASNTSSMVGTGLQGSLGSNWVYKEGFYPRLKWILTDAAKNSPDTINWYNIYAASKQAFTSVDGKTTQQDLADGEIYGTIQIPEEFTKPGFSVTFETTSGGSSSLLSKTASNTIIPRGNGYVNIRVSYGSVTNTFKFYVNTTMGQLGNVTLSAKAQVGSEITATIADVGVLYQWYRRKSGETTKQLITGQTASSYTPVVEDAGYQIQVEISKTNYGTILSSWSNIISVVAPSSAPNVNSVTDAEAELVGMGGFSDDYEYAYATSANGEKIILPKKGATASLTGLARNKQYYVYARTAAGTGYSASPWSSASTFTTDKTEIAGSVSLGSAINNGQVLTMNAESTNEQTGIWKIERVDTDGNVTEIETTTTPSRANTYTLQTADIGYKVQVSFMGSGDFEGIVIAQTETIKKTLVNAPNAPTAITNKVTDQSITFTTPSSVSDTYDIGYRESGTSTILDYLPGTTFTSGQEVTIPGLKRNTVYDVFVRIQATSAAEASIWGTSSIVTTKKTNVDGTITITGNEETNEVITFTAPSEHGQVGTWKLEKSDGTTISSRLLTISSDTRTMSYLVRPIDVDGTNKLKATFTGNNDYQASISGETGIITKAKLSTADLPTSKVVISDRTDKTLKVKTTEGFGADQYQFAVALAGTTNYIEAGSVADANKEVVINGLLRNTAYDVYIRKAAKTGYEASDYVKVLTSEFTAKTKLIGNISYTVSKAGVPVDITVGSAFINNIYTASYTAGVYDPIASDAGGTWQWYADGVAIPGATSNIYEVQPMNGTPDVTVRYIAKADSDFTDYRSMSIGTLSKSAYDSPTLPTVKTLDEDGEVGSKATIEMSDPSNVYWYVQKASEKNLPTTIFAKDVTGEVKVNKWFAASNQVTITLEPFTEYVVYTAKLEDEMHLASSILSQRAIKTVKDNLVSIHAKLNVNAATPNWKVLQNKKIEVNCQNIAVDGYWQYYVSQTPADQTSWKIINSEVKTKLDEGKTATNAYTSFQVPLKYLGYYVKVSFVGRDQYGGTIDIVSDEALSGTMLKGVSTVTDGADVTVLQPIQVEYSVNHNPAEIDETSGYWRWYRQNPSEPIDNEMILNEDGTPYGKTQLTDEYIPTAEDVGKKIYAEYNASDNSSYTGTVATNVLSSGTRAEQAKPISPRLVQVNGTSIQIELPVNYKTDGATIPDVVLGYRKAGDTGGITWLNEQVGESWIKAKLQANSEYEIYAKYKRTAEFLESAASDATLVKTGNESFDEDNLTIVTNKPSANATLKAVFKGDGYNKGYFKVVRSDNEVVADNVIGVVKDDTVTLEYTCAAADIGTNLLVQYIANANDEKYGGYVEKASNSISKPSNPNALTTPVLTTVEYDEASLQAIISSDYEYVFNESADVSTITAGEWQKLTTLARDTYTFDNLDVSKNYYLHARLAETDTYKTTSAISSAAVHPWTRTSYTITYNGMEGALNGPVDAPNKTQYSELDAFTLKDASKTGYTFLGWTSNLVTTPTKNIVIPKYSSGNLTFTANWEINKYKVTFEANGGSATANQTKEYQSFVSEPTVPTKQGNTFVGWYKDNLLQTPWNFETDKITGNTSIYAKWSINSYLAIFDGNGGSAPAAITSLHDTNWGPLPTSSKYGYDFQGWFTAVVGGEKVTEDSLTPDHNVTLYAHWVATAYQINYMLNGGNDTTDPNPSSYTIETETIHLHEPVKSGYEFLGWTWDGQDVPLKTVTIDKGSAGNKAYFANWKQLVYKITYDLDGGTNNPLNPNKYTVDDNDIHLAIPRKSGKVFTGWTLNGTGTPVIDVIIPMGSSGDRTYTANWEAADATISFDTLGGNDIASIGAKTGSLLNQPESPRKLGYTFDGWYREKACVTAWDFGRDTITGDMQLYAKWKINEYQITFDNEGTTSVITKTYGSILGTLPTPSSNGYQLIGWYDEANKKVSETTIVSKDVTYTAKWVASEYAITYELDDGVNATNNPSIYTIESEQITIQAPTKKNYVFEGWTVGTGTDKQLTVTIHGGSTGEIKLTAHWLAADHKVQFVSNGGSQIAENFVTTGQAVARPTDPTRKGYTFDGWYSDALCATAWDFSTPITADVTLYAKWNINTITATFDKNGGDMDSTVTGNYGEELGILPTATRTGYALLGWYTEAAGGDLVAENTKLLSDVVYYAHWMADEYQIAYVLDGGVNATSNATSYTIESEEMQMQMPTKEGYAFTGWTDNQMQTTLTKAYKILHGSMGDLTLTAHWVQANHTVNFDSQGGSAVQPGYAVSGQTLNRPVDPTRLGYTFMGWYKEAAGTNAWNFDTDVVNGNITLYAKWVKQSFTVQFFVDGGEPVGAMTREYNAAIGALPVTFKENYEFLGWYTNKTGGSKITMITPITNDVTFYARYKSKTFTIRYELAGGINAATNPSEYTVESETISLSAPSNGAKAFTGWTYEGQSSPVKDVEIVKGSTGNKVYTANWTDQTWKVSFDTLQGGALTDLYVEKDSLLTPSIYTPIRIGYTFKGWYKDSACTTPWNFESNKVTGDVTLYAKWSVNTYLVQFETSGGSEISSIQKDHGEVLGEIPKTSKAGNTLLGWYDQATGGNRIDATKIIEEDIKIYARWEAIPYTIDYELAGGENHNENPTTYTIENGDITLRSPYREGYAFIGWTSSNQLTPIKDLVIPTGSMGNLKYTANWQSSDYSVIFDTKGGSELKKQYVLHGERVERPSVPTKAGYSFDGWYQADDTKWNFNTGITSNITLYAKWNLVTYQLTYDYQGGKDMNNPTTYTVESESITLKNPTRLAYTFTGWTWDGQATPQTTVTITKGSTKDRTYKANWVQNTYRVVYDTAGGSAISDKTLIHWEDKNLLPSSNPTRTGYTFVKWVDEAGNEVKADKAYQDLAHDDKQTSITLKAVWLKDKEPEPQPTPTPEPTPTPKPIPTPKPEEPGPNKPEKNDPIETKPTEEEPIITKPGESRLPDVEVKGEVKDGKITLPKGETGNVSNGKTTVEVGKGSLVINISSDVEVKDMESFMNGVISKEELVSIQNGASMEIRLNVKAVKTSDDKAMIKKTAKQNKLQLDTIYQVSITKRLNDASWIKVIKLNHEVELVLPVSKKLQKLDAIFYAIRVHDGESELLEDLDDQKATVTVRTDAFSSYAIAYEESKSTSKTDDPNYDELFIGGIVVVLGAMIAVIIAKKKKEEE